MGNGERLRREREGGARFKRESREKTGREREGLEG